MGHSTIVKDSKKKKVEKDKVKGSKTVDQIDFVYTTRKWKKYSISEETRTILIVQ